MPWTLALTIDPNGGLLGHRREKSAMSGSLERYNSSRRLRPRAGRTIRTLKENLLWVRAFETVEELRLVLIAFRETYSATWLILRHNFITPAAVRQNQLQPAALAA